MENKKVIEDNVIEDNIIEIIQLLDQKILEKYDFFKRQIASKNDLEKRLKETELKLLRLQVLQEALKSKNTSKINAYNAKNPNSKLKPNYNKLVSKNNEINRSAIANQIDRERASVDELSQQLSKKSEYIANLSGKMSQMVGLLSKLKQKVINNSTAQKKMINNIYQKTQIKSVKNILNIYYGSNPKPSRSNNSLIEI